MRREQQSLSTEGGAVTSLLVLHSIVRTILRLPSGIAALSRKAGPQGVQGRRPDGGLSGPLPPPLTREGRAVWVWRFPPAAGSVPAALTVTAGERAGVPRRGSQAPSDRAPRHLRGGLPSGRHPVQPSRRTPFPSPCLIAPDAGSQTDPSPENRLQGCRAALETP